MAEPVTGPEPCGASPRWLKVTLLAAACLGVLIFTLHACTHMVAAGDTWVAMACGRHFIQHGVDTVEPFSANSHKPGPTQADIETWPRWGQWIADKVGLETVRTWHPTGWINQNWLTHVIFYWLSTSLGSEQQPYFDALVIWKVAIYLVSAACVYAVGRVIGVHPLLSAASAASAMFVGRSFLDIRPAGFSNLCVAAFILILALATYRQILWIWLIVPVTVFWANVHGGYIYVFIMLIPFMGLHLLSIPFKKGLVSMGWRGLAHTAGASVVAFVAMVLLNPYHLTNLTHTFEISVSKHAEQWRNVWEWHAAFEWINQVGTAVPFLVLFILTLTAAVVWVAARIVAAGARPVDARPKKRRRAEPGGVPLPRVDLALWALAALTIYMALRSRRFIPIAAIAAGPVLALVIQQILVSILTAACLRRKGQVSVPVLTEATGDTVVLGLGGAVLVCGFCVLILGQRLFLPVPGYPEAVQPRVFLVTIGVVLAFLAFPLSAMFYFGPGRTGQTGSGLQGPRPWVRPWVWVAALIVTGHVAGFGAWAGLRFKSIYMDPWPADPTHTSVFMRMTASFLKPFEACQFIRDNRLSGKMMNYWTEGGFVAWGQEPDPNTGRTPLQLFMDGRAQAAYNTRAFDEWSYIWAGGEPVERAAARARRDRRPFAATDYNYPEIGQWTSERLRGHGVWVVLAPAQQFDSVLIRGLETNREWPTVYMDNKQRLYVDIQTEQGRQLFEGIKTGRTVYPDEFTRQLNRAYYLLAYDPAPEVKSEGLACAIAAYRLCPSPMPMLAIVSYASHIPDLRAQIKAFCEDLDRDFEAKRDAYRRQDGYRVRVESARMAADYLGRLAYEQRNSEAAQAYSRKVKDYRDDRDALNETKKW
ncbi:MAG: hypothetical protein KBE04_02845 [Phycisphaerae bacterium]|nr:hypothetical protein [Phycisphaerae bacterium]